MVAVDFRYIFCGLIRRSYADDFGGSPKTREKSKQSPVRGIIMRSFDFGFAQICLSEQISRLIYLPVQPLLVCLGFGIVEGGFVQTVSATISVIGIFSVGF